jgi:acyl-CoA reductase-like NAD-dependent aldehyde dehydrogenase
MPAITFTEVLDTSDVPGGVVNVLTGLKDELIPWLADHMDVNAVDAGGATADQALRIQEGAVHNVKRVVLPGSNGPMQSPYRIAAFTETKTVWHPKGL